MANFILMNEQSRKERVLLDWIYDNLQIGEEKRDQSAKVLGRDLGLGERATAYVSVFEEIGILSRRMEYGIPERNGLSFGRHYHWTLLIPKDEAISRLEKFQSERLDNYQKNMSEGSIKGATKRRQNQKRSIVKAETDVTVVASNPDEETQAISGPEPDRHLGSLMNETVKALRKDEGAALIEAARQYNARTGTIQKKIDELAKLAAEIGIVFDRDKAIEAIQYDTDERLEVVVDLLPYIDKMEAQVDRLSKQLVEQSGKVRDYDRMKNENRRMQERIEHFISERVKGSQAALSQ